MTGQDEVGDRLRTLEIGFAALGATLTTKIDNLTQQISPVHLDHEQRIRKVERSIWLACGVALAGGGLLGTVGSALLNLLT